MLDLNGKTKIVDSKEFPLVAGAIVSAEGMAMINALVNGVEQVKPCNSTDAGTFIGFSYGFTMTPVYKTKVESLVVPAASPYTVTLDKEPVSGQIYITNGTTEQVAGTPASVANEYSISGKIITLHSGQASNTLTITYKYSPTAAELVYDDKVMTTSFAPQGVTGSIGVILKGEVFTDQYDANAAWSAASTVKLGAAGVLTDTGSGAQISCVVSHTPTIENPFLGLRF